MQYWRDASFLDTPVTYRYGCSFQSPCAYVRRRRTACATIGSCNVYVTRQGVAVVLTAFGVLLAGCGPAQTGAPHATGPRAAAPRGALGAGVRNGGLIVEPDAGVRIITWPIRDATSSAAWCGR
jgi:hypothetical protein